MLLSDYKKPDLEPRVDSGLKTVHHSIGPKLTSWSNSNQRSKLHLRPDKTAQLEEHISHTSNSFCDSPCVSYSTHMKAKLHICYICVGRPRSTPYILWMVIQSLRAWTVQVSWLCWSFSGLTIPFCAHNLSTVSLSSTHYLAESVFICLSQAR